MNSLIVFIILRVQKEPQFTIYNASAGSGKTYTLVKDYLKILFTSKSLLTFRNVLALTFTNKAVGEMKERIIDTLKAFSDASIFESNNSMFLSLIHELKIEPKELHQSSKTLLHYIVHNYAAFDISTIDKFNHRIIRTFANDLNLPANFEVELDTKTILAKAVDGLIDKAGTDKELTDLLVGFAIDKTEEDKSWDISYDFNAVAELLISENDIPYIEQLENKSLKDFKSLQSNLGQQLKHSNDQIMKYSKATLDMITSNGLGFNDFSRGSLPNHFLKASKLDFYRLYDNKLEDNLEQGTSIYNKSLDLSKAAIIEQLLQEIRTNYLKIKALVFESKFLKNALNNLIPLSVLSAIQTSLNALKTENNLLLISEFNAIINSEIRNQPTPFIYERLGEKFRHYFIDEFQDTSVLQWENLIPLIENAVTGENSKGVAGTAMLVGDAKQAIYRWRGGRAEQFIDLYNNGNPFYVEKEVKNLPSNYRSFKQIITFNNSFFKHVSGFVFSNPEHETIYKNAKQDIIFKNEGYVELSFLDLDKNEKDVQYCQAVLEKVNAALNNGFSLKDICIIVRRKKEGVTIAEYLSSKAIDIISSETLMLKNAPEVNFIANILGLVTQPDNHELKIEILNYLAEFKLSLKDRHTFMSELVYLRSDKFFDALLDFGFELNYHTFLQLPIYEATECIVRIFKLNENSNAYLQFFLDEVLDYSLKYNVSISGFLEYWNRKKDNLSIVSPQGEDAIQIMTIHKSKGLEFPVVIFPYANQHIYADKNPKIWFPVDKNQYNGFTHLYLNLNKDFENYNALSQSLYLEYRTKLELDSINLLYVVLTRAIEQLYVISEFDVDKAQSEKLDYYSGLFINYLKQHNYWEDNKYIYAFGNPIKTSESNDQTFESTYLDTCISTAKEEHRLHVITRSGYLWDTAQEQALEKGILIHDIMSKIKTSEDIESALDDFKTSGLINNSQYESLKPQIIGLVNHAQLKPYFQSEYTIYNEQDIMSSDGHIFRPDRIAINENKETIIIDYKTGLLSSTHEEQLYDYQTVLEQMDYKVIKKILVYINDDITIKEF